MQAERVGRGQLAQAFNRAVLTRIVHDENLEEITGVIRLRQAVEAAAEDREIVPGHDRRVHRGRPLARLKLHRLADAPAEFGVPVQAANLVKIGMRGMPAPFLFPVRRVNLADIALHLPRKTADTFELIGKRQRARRRPRPREVDGFDGGLDEDLVAAHTGRDAEVVVVGPTRRVVFVEAARGVDHFASVVRARPRHGIHFLNRTRVRRIGGERQTVTVPLMPAESADEVAAERIDPLVGEDEFGADDARLGLRGERFEEEIQPVGCFDHDVAVHAHHIVAARGSKAGI